MSPWDVACSVGQFVLDKGPVLLLLGQIVGVYVLMLFGRYKAAVLLVVSAAVTLLLGW